MGLDRPFLAQYLSWMGNVLRGDLGVSYYNGVSVTAEIRRAFPVTMQLTLASLLSALTVALILGILAGLREGGLPDLLTRGLAVLGTCVPSFWFGLALMFLFAVKLDLLPAVGKEGAASFILPAATLAFGSRPENYLPANWNPGTHKRTERGQEE